MNQLRRSALLLLVMLSACPAPMDPPPDGGSLPDAGGLVDAGVPTPDASVDAGVDAGVPLPPETNVTSRPTGVLGASGSASFEFACDQGPCTFECAWDQETFAACTSPASRANFTDGRHAFSVRAARNGLIDATPALETFEVDAAPPTVTFTVTPTNGAPNSRASAFAVSCSETSCALECSLDGAAFAACPAPLSFDALAPGSHTLAARGVDAAGNVSMPATHTWSLVFGWRSFAVTETAACGITGQRQLACWGSDSAGQLGLGLVGGTEGRAQPTLVGTRTDWASIRNGNQFFCARDLAGATSCWGRNATRQMGDSALMAGSFNVPTPVAHRFEKLSVGDRTACGVDDGGALFCWGEGEQGALGDGDVMPHQVVAPQRVGAATWRSVSVRNHVCGVQTDGSLWCFGPNDSGEAAADPTMTSELAMPTRVGTDSDWLEVTAGEQFTCALKQSGALFCFGENGLGQLGIGTTDSTHVLSRVGGARTFSTVRAYGAGVCAIDSVTQRGSCWGDNGRSESGTGGLFEFTSLPGQIGSTSSLVSVGGRHRLRCALTVNDGLECWGDNLDSRGGLGRGVSSRETTQVVLDGTYTSLSLTSNLFSGPGVGGCGIKGGALVCWGIGSHVALGSLNSFTPATVGTATNWTEVSLSSVSTPLWGLGSMPQYRTGHGCGVRGAEILCWGTNSWGQLGIGNTNDTATPTVVPPPAAGVTWAHVAVGALSSCGITSLGKLNCWGFNMSGQLGDGTTQMSTSPTGLSGSANLATDWTQVSINGSRVAARRGNGTLWQWGQGVGSTPTQIDAATDWEEGQPGSNFFCGRKTNGTVHCKASSQAAATQVGTFSDATRLLRFNSSRSCVLRAGGAVTCFSFNGTDWVLQPQLSPAGTWASVEVLADLTCGVGADGQRRCLGFRWLGSFGDGFDERVPQPVLAP